MDAISFSQSLSSIPLIHAQGRMIYVLPVRYCERSEADLHAACPPLSPGGRIPLSPGSCA